jgi:sulfur carrier protein ThiS
MKILVNEREVEVAAGTTVEAIRDRLKPDADVLTHNGAPATPGTRVSEGDEIVLIRRGEVPGAEELEALMAARHTPGVHRKVKAASVGSPASAAWVRDRRRARAHRRGTPRPRRLRRRRAEQPEPPAVLRRPARPPEGRGARREPPQGQPLRAVRGPRGPPDSRKRPLHLRRRRRPRGSLRPGRREGRCCWRPTGRPIPGARSSWPRGSPGTGHRNSMGVKKIGTSIYVVGDLESAAQPGWGSWPRGSGSRRISRRTSPAEDPPRRGSMKVTLSYHAQVRQAAGTESESIELPEGADASPRCGRPRRPRGAVPRAGPRGVGRPAPEHPPPRQRRPRGAAGPIPSPRGTRSTSSARSPEADRMGS